MQENQNTKDQELDSFVEAFTAGLEPDVSTLESSEQPSATPSEPAALAEEPAKGDQDSNKSSGDGTSDTPKSDEEAKNQQKDESDKGSKSDEPKENVEDVFTKSDRAFAELRTTNKAQGEFLLRMARLAKLEAKTPAEAIAVLTKQVEKLEASHGNLTYDEVERIRQQDRDLAEQKAQLRQKATAGFDELKRLHKLSDQDLLSFAGELKAKGINPFEIPVDIVAQYRGMRYDQLIAEAKEAGRQEELARRAKAQTQATIPVTKQGGTDNEPGESLNSVDRLSAFLNSK